MRETIEILKSAVKAKSRLMLTSEEKNRGLEFMAQSLIDNSDEILKANKKDVSEAKGKISEVMIDRLFLDFDRIKAMADGIKALTKLEDPTDNILSEKRREDDLIIRKISVPIGVVAIIYESRPNVTSDAAALCFKSGNVCVLRSGKEAFLSAYAIVNALKRGLKKAGLDENLSKILQETVQRS